MTSPISGLSSPKVIVNNEVIRIVPNSLKVDRGLGTVTVNSASGGGYDVQLIHNVSAKDMVAHVKFSIYTTAENLSKKEEWKLKIAGNAISVTDKDPITQQDKTYTYVGLSLVNSGEDAYSEDGQIELDFAGQRVI